MLSWLRRRITYANIVVTVGLVLIMSGGAFAAKHFIITSTSQISPKVLKALRGARGATGATGERGATGATGATGVTGATGATGPQGSEGKEGSPWVLGGTLPSGKSLKGDWMASDDGETGSQPRAIYGAVSFGIPLESEPVPLYVKVKESMSEHCRGSAVEPTADPGYLCVYASEEVKVEVFGSKPKVCSGGRTEIFFNCVFSTASPKDDRTGFVVGAIAEPAGYAYGTWAVTAE